ncbi:actin binding protein [Ectocarpus siliculosus]|uniref:Actin binding protein n=1 Tax=Ectocarpus siliculosus TaxID=2880 RepID=D8LSR6_ECTSI|nr:actin binding protein [Ectocarpus siliculosus]|eukprot:CBN75266.1 actin binding protein [Ectocarpus siliculosus]
MLVARNHVHRKAPVIGEALQAAIANVRSDTAREDWVLCGFDGGGDIRLFGTGVGGVEALKASIVEWDVCYGLVRCSYTLEQAGDVQTGFVKFVWVYWRPDNIPVIRKMKIGVNEGEMKSVFAPYHAELQACALHELGEQPLADVLDSVTMRADRTKTRKLERPPSSPSLLARGRAAWKLARSALPSMPFAHLATADEQKKVAASANVEFEEPKAFGRAVKDVRSDMSFADWCLLGYKNETVLRMVGTGKGGLQCLLDAAEPSGVNYGLLRVSEKFDGVFHEAYCFISWIPENIPAFVKARVSTHQGSVATAFRKHVHCQFYFRASERSDVTMDVIRNRVCQIIGKAAGAGAGAGAGAAAAAAAVVPTTTETAAAPATTCCQSETDP